MHKKGYVHRDIKPDNILVFNEQELKVCIADLGFACSLRDEINIKNRCGSAGYTAPEVLEG